MRTRKGYGKGQRQGDARTNESRTAVLSGQRENAQRDLGDATRASIALFHDVLYFLLSSSLNKICVAPSVAYSAEVGDVVSHELDLTELAQLSNVC